MSQLDATRTLALLLRDSELRHRFARDRSAVVRELGVAQDHVSFVRDLDFCQLDAQAEALIRKRRAEVASLIPKTWLRLGREGRKQFRQYADQSPWPEGHRRHYIDAAMFCKFLRANAASEYLRFEHNWVAFLASHRFFSFHILNDLMVHGEDRWGVQLCLRRNRGVTNKIIYFRSIRTPNDV